MSQVEWAGPLRPPGVVEIKGSGSLTGLSGRLFSWLAQVAIRHDARSAEAARTLAPPQLAPGAPCPDAGASESSVSAYAVGIGKWAPLVELAHWPDARTVTRTQARTSRTFEQ